MHPLNASVREAGMKSRMSRPTPISEVLKEKTSDAHTAERMKRYAIWDRWRSLVGDEVAAHARPARWQGNVLIVRVEHPTWIQELGFLKPQMMERLRGELPKAHINDIRFEVGELPKDPEPESSTQAPPTRKLSESEKDLVHSASAEISDPDIREAAEKAMSKCLSTKPRR